MQRALVEVLVLALACGPLGVWILLYRQSYAAESISHAMLPGLVIASLAGAPLLLGAAGGVLVAARGDRARRARRARSAATSAWRWRSARCSGWARCSRCHRTCRRGWGSCCSATCWASTGTDCSRPRRSPSRGRVALASATARSP